MRSVCFILFLSTGFVSFVRAQDISQDMDLLLSVHQKNESLVKPSKKKRSFNPLSLLYGATLGFYQQQISPQWGANCAFELTCSRFSGAMVKEYGIAKGFFLTFDRMGRCNKLSMYETLPLRITSQGKIVDDVSFYRLQE